MWSFGIFFLRGVVSRRNRVNYLGMFCVFGCFMVDPGFLFLRFLDGHGVQFEIGVVYAVRQKRETEGSKPLFFYNKGVQCTLLLIFMP